MKRLALFLCCVLFVLSACTPVQQISEPADDPIVVVDALGREVRLEKAPTRIAVTGNASIMIMDALYMFPEAASRTAAYLKFTQGTGNFLSLLDPDYAGKAFLKLDAGVEQLVEAKPDLVLMKSFLASEYDEPLKALNIPVVYLDFETPEQYERDLRVLGKILQNEDRAEELVLYYDSKVDEIYKALAVSSYKPNVLMLYYNDKDGAVAFNVPPMSWIQTKLVEMAYGQAIWQDANPGSGWTKVSLEQIAAWDADDIFVISYNEDSSAVVEKLKADPKWQQIRAVKDARIWGFPADYYSWDQPDTRWVLGLQWLATKLHPEAFADWDILARAKNFYQFAYGLDSAFFEEHIKPTLRGDLP